jgi:phosphoglycerate-specific signal transduction histidine kinase
MQNTEPFEVLANAVTDLVVTLRQIASDRRQRAEDDRLPFTHARMLEATANEIHNALKKWPGKDATVDLRNLTYELMGLGKNLDSQSYPDREQPVLDQGIAKIVSNCAKIVRSEREELSQS